MEAAIRCKNPHYKKTKNSFYQEVSCAFCKAPFAIYEKAGRGNLIKMQLHRILASEMDLDKVEGELLCPSCGQGLAKKADYKGRPAIWIIRGRVNVRRL